MPRIGTTTPYAKHLRQNATQVEKRLWVRLRNRQLGGFKFRRQATVGPFIADFLCVERRLVVELDGGQHSEKRDFARTVWLERQGYRVMRFWNNDVVENEEGVLEALLFALTGSAETTVAPSPNPLPLTGEG